MQDIGTRLRGIQCNLFDFVSFPGWYYRTDGCDVVEERQQFVIILIAILGALSTHVKWIFNIGLADSVRRTTIFLYGVERQPRMQLLSGLPPSPRWKYD